MPVQKKAFCTGMRIGIFMMITKYKYTIPDNPLIVFVVIDIDIVHVYYWNIGN